MMKIIDQKKVNNENQTFLKTDPFNISTKLTSQK